MYIYLFSFHFPLHSNKTFYCGLQASIRKLKSAHIKLLVLSADLKPKYVTNQIIIQALANNQDIRILCITNMTNFTQTLLNFSCYAFVVGHEHWSEMPELDLWTAKIVDENFPLPLLIKKHFPKRPETNSNTAMEVDEQCQMTKEKGTKIDPNNIVCDGDLKDLHLIRDNCDVDQRVFVPKNGINLKPIVLEIESLNKIKSDFVSLETYSNSNDATSTFDFKSIKGCEKNAKKKGKRPLALYRELTIHKIQNNPNKMKKPNDRKNKKKNKQK